MQGRPGPLQMIQKVAGWVCATAATILATFLVTRGVQPSGRAVVPILVGAFAIGGLAWFFVPGKLKEKEKKAAAVAPPPHPAATGAVRLVDAGAVESAGAGMGVAGRPLKRPVPPPAVEAPPSMARRRGPSLNMRAVHEGGEQAGEAAGRAVTGLINRARRHS